MRGYAENQLGPRILTIDDSTLLDAARRAPAAAPCAPTIDAVKFCDPNSPQASATAISFRSRSAERRCSRAASSTAFRCRSARRSGISSARCSSTAASSAAATSAACRSISEHHQRHGRDHAGLRHSLRIAGRTDPRRLRHQSRTATEDSRRRDRGARQRPGSAADRSARDAAPLLAGQHAAGIASCCISRSERRTSGGWRG